MSEVVGFELNPEPDTSLSQMIEYGLSKHLDRSIALIHDTFCSPH